MGYGSIINKLNSFMDNIEDPEQTKQNLEDFNLGFNSMPAKQLEGETFKFKRFLLLKIIGVFGAFKASKKSGIDLFNEWSNYDYE